MSDKVNGNKKENMDETLLLVRGSSGDKEKDKDHVKKVANAILKCHANHGVARLRCVGAGSLNNGVKALIIATGEASKNGEELVCSPKFTDVSFDSNGKKTGILIEIFSREDV